MATRHDNRNCCPVRDALLKWQLQQDEQRVAEVQHRLMCMAAPSPSSSLGVNSSSFDHRIAARRPRRVHHTDRDEDAITTLIMEQEERESITANDPNDFFKASKLQYPPSLLLPLRRSKPPLNSVKRVSLRSTGQKINAPLRPRELQNTSSDIRQNLTFSRIKTPTQKGKSIAPSRRGALQYDEMKIPIRRRRTAMQSNQEKVDGSVLKKWQEKDARDGDNGALWNDLFYGNKAAHTKANQLPEQPLVYSTSGLCERFSRSRSNSHGSSCYENGDGRPTFPVNVGMGDDGMVSSELSTMTISEQTKQSTTQHSDIGSPALDANGFSAPTSRQSIAEMLASMDKPTEVEIAEDCGAGGNQNYDGSSCGDQKQFSRDEFSADDALFAQVEGSSGIELPRCSLVVVACCLVIGTSGFFVKELMALVGLFSKRKQFLLSRVEQERMRDRISILQQELQGFQLLTFEIEVRSQTVLTELRQYMDRMRLDREKHQDMLAKEMQELRRHILHATHDLVEQERASIQTQLEEIVKVHNVGGVDDNSVIAEATATENDKKLEKATTGAPIQAQPYLTMHEGLHETIAGPSSPASTREDTDEQFRLVQIKVEPSHELVTNDDTVVSSVREPRHVDNEQAHVDFAENGHAPVGAPSQLMTGELVNVQHSEIKLESPILVQQVNVEHALEVESVLLPALEQSLNKIDDTAVSASKMTVNVKPSHNASGVSWNEILLLLGILFLAACVMLRVYNTNRRKRWFEKRRKRRNQRALRLALRRARAMAEHQDDSDEWHGVETDGDIEEVSLMPLIRDQEDDEARPKLQRHSSDIDTDVDRHSHSKRSRT